MANTFTPYYNLIKPEVGSDTNAWGVHINSDIDTIDATMNTNAVAAAAAQATANAAVPKAGGTMTGALVLPANGLTVGTTQLVVSGGNVSMSGQLSATGNFSTGGTITSSGAVTFGGNITNTGTLSTSSNGSFGGTLSVTGAGTFSSTLAVTGAVTLSSTLSVSNNVTIQSSTSERRIYIGSSGGYFYGNATNAGWNGAGNVYWDFSGNFTASGNVTAYSDEKLKKDIHTIQNALDLVKQLRGVTFTRIDTDEPSIGVIAQEVQKVIPEVVQDNDGTLSVAYGNMVGVLIEAVKELSDRVRKLEAR